MSQNGKFHLRAYFGHHKCATSWIDTILMEVCFHLGLQFEIVHQERDVASYGGLQALVEEREVNFLAYTNAKMEEVEGLAFTRGFHVIRDPRDILVSAYFSHLRTHPTDNWPELIEHRAQLQQASKEEGLFLEMDFSEGQFRDMANWNYDRSDILEYKMENLTADPVAGFTEIFEYLGMLDRTQTEGIQRVIKQATLNANRLLYRGRKLVPSGEPLRMRTWHSIPEEKAISIINAKSFSKLAGGRKKGQESRSSHYRKGVPGDWANHFSIGHKKQFKERFNDVLVELGYEDDDTW